MSPQRIVTGAQPLTPAKRAGAPVPASATPQAPRPAKDTFAGRDPILKVGARGKAVSELQGLLKAAGVYDGAPDGQFGPGTRSAVVKFQQAMGLPMTGVVDAQVWFELKNPIVADGTDAIEGVVIEDAPPRTAEQIVREAQQVLSRPGGDWETSIATRRIERIPLAPTSSGRDKFVELKQQVRANAPVVAERLQGLKPEERAAYTAIAQRVRDKDLFADLALQMLLLAEPSALLAPAQNHAGETLLQALDRLIRPDTALHDKIDRAELVSHLLREVAMPASINQAQWGTCTVTTIQILTAKEDPAEFVRIVGGLASPEGHVTLRSGQEIQRVAGTESGVIRTVKSGAQELALTDDRSIPTRLWANALMEFGNGDGATYDPVRDQHSNTNRSGLTSSQTERVLDAVSGDDHTGAWGPGSSLIERIRQSLGRGEPVPIALDWGASDTASQVHSSHQILITRMDDTRVYYDNPWGQEEHMAIDQFQARLQHALFAPEPKAAEAVPAPMPERPPGFIGPEPDFTR